MLAEDILFIVFGTFTRNEYMIQDTAGIYLQASAAAIGRALLYRKCYFNVESEIYKSDIIRKHANNILG